MRFVVQDLPPPSARWTTRLAFFSAALLASALFLHRLFGMPTPVAVNVVVGFGVTLSALRRAREE